MKGLKRLLPILALMMALAVIGIVYINLFYEKDSEVFKVKDISGDVSVLADTKISGVLRDARHQISFEWIQHQVNTQREVFRSPQQVNLRPYLPGGELTIGNKDYAVHGQQNFEIVERDRSAKDDEQFKSAKVHSGLTYQWGKINDDADVSNRYSNPLEYGLTAIGEDIFFIIPNSAVYAGTNSLYELNFSQDSSAKSREVAKIDLKTNGIKTFSNPETNIEVLGLESVGDQLAVVMSVEGKLVVRGYDSVSGNLTGEVSVGDVNIDGIHLRLTNHLTIVSPLHSTLYQAYSDTESGTLNLKFDMMSYRADGQNVTFVSIDMHNGVKLLSNFTVGFDNPKESVRDLVGIVKVAYLQNHLYVIRMEEDESAANYKHLYVYVYNNDGMLVYKGELVTSMNDDYATWSEDPEGYHSGKYRFFDNWAITPVKK